MASHASGKAQAQVQVKQLPTGERLCHVIEGPPEVDQAFKCRILVLGDISGSMGPTVPLIMHDVLPAIFQSWGVPRAAEIRLCLFEAHTHKSVTTPDTLRGGVPRFEALGSTLMHPAAYAVGNDLLLNPGNALLIIFSDGDLHDLAEVKALMTRLHPKMAQRAGTLTVVLFRIGRLAATDAMSNFGIWDNTGSFRMFDIGDDVKKDMLEKAQQVNLKSRLVTETTGCLLRSFPGQAYSQTVSSDTFLLHPDCTEITINGHHMALPEAVAATANDLHGLLDQLSVRIRFLQVAGGHDPELQALAQWCTEMEPVFTHTLKAPWRSTSMQRLRQLKAQMSNQLDSIRQLLNSNRTSTFTMSQQDRADYLRGPAPTAAGNRLVKRANRLDVDVDELARQCVYAVALGGNEVVGDAKDELCASFLSLDTTKDAVSAMMELAQDASILDVCPAQVLLPIVAGILGLGYRNKPSSLPNPWDVQVYEVFHDGWISCSDFLQCKASKIEPQTATTREPLTGLIPLTQLDAYGRWIQKQARPIVQMCAGVFMRETLAPLPGDEIALVAAGLRRVVQDVTHELLAGKKPLQVCIDHMLLLLKELRMHVRHNPGLFALTVDAMNKPDFRFFLIGANDMSQFLRPWAVLVAGEVTITPELMFDMLTFHMYHEVRNHCRMAGVDHTVELHRYLGLMDTVDVGAPGTSDPVMPQFCDLAAAMPIPDDEMKLYMHMDAFLDMTAYITRPSLSDAFRPRHQPRRQQLIAYVYGWMAKTQEERLARPVLTTEDELTRYIQEYMSSHMQSVWTACLKQKRDQEQALLEAKQCEELRQCQDHDFVRLLQAYAPNRDARVSQLLIPHVPTLSALKIYVYLTGRLLEDVVWNGGNIWRVSWGPYLTGLESHVANNILATRVRFASHAYRTLPNRHGWSNDNPSFFAQGYDTEHAYMESLSDVEKEEYLTMCTERLSARRMQSRERRRARKVEKASP